MTEITLLHTSEIVPGNNDRTVFDPRQLAELAASIAEYGLIQPITVRRLNTDEVLYQIVAGERRYRAICLLGWEEVPCLIQDLSDEEASAVMLAENVSRADLDPIDEALAYANRIDLFGWTVADVAQKAGVSQVRVQFRLQLLALKPDLQKLVRDGQLPIGYAQIIARAELDSNFQVLAMRAFNNNSAPTLGWFRRAVSELQERQNQRQLFDLPLFGGPVISEVTPTAVSEPPHPATTKPPTVGKTARDIIANQIKFWQEAANRWHEAGKPFKRQECEAAAQALGFALATL